MQNRTHSDTDNMRTRLRGLGSSCALLSLLVVALVSACGNESAEGVSTADVGGSLLDASAGVDGGHDTTSSVDGGDQDTEGGGTVDSLTTTPDTTPGDVSTSSDTAADAGQTKDSAGCATDADCVDFAGGLLPCRRGICQVATGVCVEALSVDGSKCTDGDLCTEGDACVDGSCIGKAKTCDTGSDTDCVKTTCSAQSGLCETKPLADGSGCDDGSLCSGGDTCTKGSCAGAAISGCDDNNPCTADTCDPTAGCVYAANALPCNDGDECSIGDACQGGQCKGADTKTCDDANPCTDDVCIAGMGCVALPNKATCDDGNICTEGDACLGGQCAGGKNSCGCEANADCSKFDDGDACSGALICDKSSFPFACKIDPKSVVTCDPSKDTSCLKNVCNTKTGACGLKAASDTTPCDDGDKCTVNDRCIKGVCGSDTKPNCNDGNPCTLDSCESAKGCVATAQEQLPCDDGNVCSISDTCQGGVCKGGATLNCKDDLVCTTSSCKPVIGCQTKLTTGGTCSDGNACTTKDSCVNGACLGGAAVVCDDNNPCTDDGCELAKGCAFTTNARGCDDGDACTIGDKCAKEACVSGAAKSCLDDEVCTQDTCHKGSCVHLPIQHTCTDANPCTDNDTCKQGSCSGVAKGCDDGLACTTDKCDGKTGACVSVPAGKGSPCNDGDVCSDKDACDGLGKCVGAAKPCEDGNACTTDTCVPATGCVHKPGPEGAACGAQSTCSTKTCAAGVCKSLTEVDGTPCVPKEICGTGVCGKGLCVSEGARLHAGAAGSGSTSLGPQAMAAWGNGYVVASNTSKSAWRLDRYSGTGKQVWAKNLAFAEAGNFGVRFALRRGDDVLIFGTSPQKQGAAEQVWSRTLSPGDKLSNTYRWYDKLSSEGADINNGCVLNNGDLMLSGGRADSINVWTARYTQTGNKLWSATWKVAASIYGNHGFGTRYWERLANVACLDDGRVVVGTTGGGANDADIRVFDEKTGQQVWAQQHDPSPKQDIFTETVALAGGHFVVLGNYKREQLYLAHGRPAPGGKWAIKGTVISKLTAGEPRVIRALPLSDGSIVAHLYSGKDVIVRVSPTGKVLFHRELPGGVNHLYGVRLAELHDGDIAFAGLWYSQKSHWTGRMDRHGNFSCSSGGACSAAADTCDDGKACTVDLCTGQSLSCEHLSGILGGVPVGSKACQ